jgi:hypothetical protein
VEYITAITTTNDTGLVWRPDVVPVQITVKGQITGSASATVTVSTLNHTTLLEEGAYSQDFPNPNPSFNRTVVLMRAPDSLLRIVLQAAAQAFDTLGDPINFGAPVLSSKALADPVFSFDQAAFDLYAAEAGQPTFDLNLHYAFEFSSGIGNGNSVPDPGTLVALLAACAPMRWRRRGSPA